jgi:hypothetical protein
MWDMRKGMVQRQFQVNCPEADTSPLNYSIKTELVFFHQLLGQAVRLPKRPIRLCSSLSN